MNRDSKGRFCSNEKNGTYTSNLHKKLMETIDHGIRIEDPDDWYFKNIKNDTTEEGSIYTVGVKVEAYYDVDVRANSPEEAIQKISKMDSYKLLTENIPVDSRDPVFSWLALQDE